MKQLTRTRIEGETLDAARPAHESAATRAVAGLAYQATIAVRADWPMSNPDHGHVFGMCTKPRPRWQEVPS